MILSDWLGIVGLVLTIGGFAVTLIQLARTKTAADAATEALRSTVSCMSTNHLLVLLPQFRMIDIDMDTARA